MKKRMQEIILIGIGGFLGAISRYAIGLLFPKSEPGFFYSTFIVNIVGSFLLSLWLFLDEWSDLVPAHLRSFVALGFLGAFTTMSTFSYELLQLINTNNWKMFSVYLAFTIGGIILGAFSGRQLAQHVSNSNFTK